MNLSVIITAHKEGLLLHKTLLSIKKSLDFSKEKKYEIILNLDNSDKQTQRIADFWAEDHNAKVFNVSFGNPADNRNDAIKKSSGKYILILDGDDLVSENWIKNGFQTLKNSPSQAVVRPEIHIQFGYNEQYQTVWRMRNSSEKSTDAIQMAYWNLWTNTVMAPREILLKTPYRKPADGFGFEDYLFGTELISKGVANLVAPETVLFYRRRDFSVTTQHQDTILDYSPLFDIDFIKSIPLQETPIISHKETFSQKSKRRFKRLYRFSFDTAKKIGPVNKLIGPYAKKLLVKRNLNRVPSWLIDEWKNINSIENQLWPTDSAIATIQFHPLTFDPFENSYGLIYQNLCNQLNSNRLDYLFLAPSMSGIGGTEKLIANYIKAIKKSHPEWEIGILSTHPFNQLTIDFFKKLNVSVLDFGNFTKSIGDYEKNIIWSRLLIQSKVKNLHIVNDQYWYKWVAKHKKLITSNNFKINISLFMREFTHEKSRILSFSDPDLSEIWPAVNKVFTDNNKVIEQALENNFFEKEKFITHYQPEDVDNLIEPKTMSNDKPTRILWASRIAFQKRPDILKSIAQQLDDNFIIDAYGNIEKNQYSQDFFSDSKINYRGGFKGIESINTSRYDLYLYTSETDGIPNILIEIAKSGLPIIASNIGGISELIAHSHSGILVEMEDIDGYIEALNQLRNNPDQAKKFAINLQKTIKKQHSWDKFEKEVERDIC